MTKCKICGVEIDEEDEELCSDCYHDKVNGDGFEESLDEE